MAKVTAHREISLYELYRLKELRRKYLLPDWQRDLVWGRDNINGWFEDIKKGGIMPGVIITFTHGDQNAKEGPIYINDGAQRTLATSRFYEKCKSEGMSKEEIYDILSSAYIHIQHMHYDIMKSAYEDFFRINIGTLCTSYELGRGIIANRMGETYKSIWCPKLNKLHEVVAGNLQRIGITVPHSRDGEHKSLRDDYGLFVRFCNCDKGHSKYYTSRKHLKREDIKGNKVSELVESKLCNLLEEYGPDEFDRRIRCFEKLLSDTMAMYEITWNRYMKEGTKPNRTHMRFTFAVSIYRKNNNIPISDFEKYLIKSITMTKGNSAVKDDDNRKRGMAKMALSDLSSLPALCKELNIPNFCDRVRRDYSNSGVNYLKSGYDRSHKKPFVIHGNGEVIIEPSLINESRGASAII